MLRALISAPASAISMAAAWPSTLGAGASKIKLVGNAGRQKILAGAKQLWVAAYLVAAGKSLDRPTIPTDIIQEIGVETAAGKDSDGPGEGAGIVARVFQGFPSAF